MKEGHIALGPEDLGEGEGAIPGLFEADMTRRISLGMEDGGRPFNIA